MGFMVSPETLRQFPLFASLQSEILAEFAMSGELVSLASNTTLFHAGEKATALYIILEGCVEIRTAVGLEGTCQIGVSTLRKGDLLGWSALVEPYIYQMSAVATAASKLIKFDGVCICEILTHNPEVGYVIMSRITETIGSRLNDLRVRFISLIEGGRWQHFSVRKSLYIDEGGRANLPFDDVE
jgi:CRP-like cAMP-binding protein